MDSIALIGKARSGKDTAARRLVEEHGYTRVAFADPLKVMALRVDPMIPTDLVGERRLHARLSELVEYYGWEWVKDCIPESRRLLQEMGQTVREYDPDFWVRIALAKIEIAPGPVVVSDVRYPNEAAALARAGFRVVRLVRTTITGRSLPGAQHSSETALDDATPELTIYNNGDVPYLHRSVDALAT